MAAHKSRRFGSHVTVTNKNNGRSVRVRITDRGPFIKGLHRPVSSSSQRNRHGRDRARNRSVTHEAREGDRDDPVLFTVRFLAGEKLSDLRQNPVIIDVAGGGRGEYRFDVEARVHAAKS
jgi:hypothetical protein